MQFLLYTLGWFLLGSINILLIWFLDDLFTKRGNQKRGWASKEMEDRTDITLGILVAVVVGSPLFFVILTVLTVGMLFLVYCVHRWNSINWDKIIIKKP
jgi:hypothetical protein